LRSCRSSMMSSSTGRSLASGDTRKRSSMMSSGHRSILPGFDFDCTLCFATFRAPVSLEAPA
jgi:hypothetical protein